ncbi:MAG TPA: signal peptidase I [Solirubrobacteraceae bacterium]|nr:signal peptidase I [Solirubrobacteraceae bacterium]
MTSLTDTTIAAAEDRGASRRRDTPPGRGAPRRRLLATRRGLTRAAATGLLALLLAAAAAVAGGAAAGITPHVELSDSMRPLLRAGDVLWLERIGAEEAGVGDVVAFDDPERRATVLHRVERVREAAFGRLAFTTRGDANGAGESWAIDRDGRVGRYVGVRVPFAGRIVRTLQGPALAAIAALSGLVLAGLALRGIWSS